MRFIGSFLAGFFVIIPMIYIATSSSSTTTKIKLGHYKFLIPIKYSGEEMMPARLRRQPGLDDDSRDVLIEFPAEEIAEHIRSYSKNDGRLYENITARLIVLTPFEIDTYKDTKRYRDLWDGEGSYLGRIIEQYNDRPWFKVFRKVEYPYAWAVLTRLPEKGKTLPKEIFDFWIADCLTQGSPLTARGQHTSCETHILSNDIAIEFRIADKNLDVITDVKEYILAKVLAWKQPVEGQSRP